MNELNSGDQANWESHQKQQMSWWLPSLVCKWHSENELKSKVWQSFSVAGHVSLAGKRQALYSLCFAKSV